MKRTAWQWTVGLVGLALLAGLAGGGCAREPTAPMRWSRNDDAWMGARLTPWSNLLLAASSIQTRRSDGTWFKDNALRALDLKDGRELWRLPEGGGEWSAHTNVFWLRTGRQLRALDPVTRVERWRIEVPAPVIGYALYTSHQAVLVATKEGARAACAYAAEDGRLLWRAALDDVPAALAPPRALPHGRLGLLLGHPVQALLLLDAASGTRIGTLDGAPGTLALIDDHLYLQREGVLLRYDLAAAALQPEPLGSADGVLGVYGPCVYYPCGLQSSALLALGRSAGGVTHVITALSSVDRSVRIETGLTNRAEIVHAADALALIVEHRGPRDDVLHVYDLTARHALWARAFPAVKDVVVARGWVCVASTDGTVTALGAYDGRVAWRYRVPGATRYPLLNFGGVAAHLTTTDGALLVHQNAHLACLDLAAP